MYLLNFNLKIGQRLNGESPQNVPFPFALKLAFFGESFTLFFGLGRRK